MRHLLLPALLYLLSLTLAAGQPQPGTSAARPSLAELRQQLDQLAQAAQGRVGVAATLLETGETVAVRGTERFPMQSVYKFPIGMATLHQVDAGKLRLDQSVQVRKPDYVSDRQHSPIRDNHPDGVTLPLTDLLRYAVSESDGSASDVLMRLAGGSAGIETYLRSLGVRGVRVINTEQELGRTPAVQYANWAQPAELVALLRAVQQGRGLSPTSRTLLLRLMTETPTGLRRLKALLPPGTLVAHKTGSSGTVDGLTAATNDVGLLTLPNGQHIAIAVLVADAKADEATRDAVIARIAKAVWDYWQ